jgi:hypothetical protein
MAIKFLNQGQYKITFEDGSEVRVESENSFFAEVGQTTVGTTTFATVFPSKIIKVERL